MIRPIGLAIAALGLVGCGAIKTINKKEPNPDEEKAKDLLKDCLGMEKGYVTESRIQRDPRRPEFGSYARMYPFYSVDEDVTPPASCDGFLKTLGVEASDAGAYALRSSDAQGESGAYAKMYNKALEYVASQF